MRKKLGEGSTAAELALEGTIRKVTDWYGREIHYEVVPGGISNSNWKVIVAGDPCSYFVKVPGAGTEMFINRDAAHDASVKAYRAGVGARVHCYFPETGIEVSQFLEGMRTATNGDFLDRTVRSNAVRALRAFNDGERLTLRKTLFDMIDEHIEQALSLGARFPHDFGWINACYRQARSAIEASGLDVVPCMNDTLAGNFLLDKDSKISLVDFEYASNNDRCAELAVWLGEMFFTPETEREIVEEYFGKSDAAILARLTLYRALADVKWATWAMVQNKISALDFDFFKYGIWKHMRARSLMSDSRWSQWLRSV
jgi:thiamine kinase-like enzyme